MGSEVDVRCFFVLLKPNSIVFGKTIRYNSTNKAGGVNARPLFVPLSAKQIVIVRLCDEILALSGQISMDKAKMIANKVASSVPKTIDEATLLNYYCSFKLCLLPHYPLVGAVCPIYF